MGTEEGPPSGLSTEVIAAKVEPDPSPQIEASQPEHTVGDEEIYDAIRRLRVMALGLGVAAARTRDGLYTAYAYNATATAGILRRILEERDSPFLETLRNEEAVAEENTGARQLL